MDTSEWGITLSPPRPEFFYSAKDTDGVVKTRIVSKLSDKNIEKVNAYLLQQFYSLSIEASHILENYTIEKLYKTHYKRKSSGGLRRMDEPCEFLKDFMKRFVNLFVNDFNLLFPCSSYAYVPGKNTKELVKVHKGNKLILHYDLKDFFRNCSFESIMTAMEKVYPFCVLDTTYLEPIVRVCMYDFGGKVGLAQGAPSSPFLSNVLMIPFDYYVTNDMGRYHYTRYADDIFVSFDNPYKAKRDFTNTKKTLITRLNMCLPSQKLNNKKCKYYDLYYSNGCWITGIMLNSNGDITIGHNNKQILKATIFSFLMDYKNGKTWNKKETQKMQGKVAHYEYIEPEYVKMIIAKYEEKTGVRFKQSINDIIHS